MSLECGECERDLRGGHGGGCSRHPINKRGHPMHKYVKRLRKSLGKRDEHHQLCNSRIGHACDCYAKGREDDHEALDLIVEWMDRGDE